MRKELPKLESAYFYVKRKECVFLGTEGVVFCIGLIFNLQIFRLFLIVVGLSIVPTPFGYIRSPQVICLLVHDVKN